MKKETLKIINEYLTIFSEEKERQSKLITYLNNHNDIEIIDWNNFEGHIVASGFIYAKKEQKFLVLYHNDLKTYLYPGGHLEQNDKSIYEAAKREVEEETGLTNIQVINISTNDIIPIDIDTHIIGYNERLNLPKHYHFDFRYLFIIDNIEDITIDTSELSNYKWISLTELENNSNYGSVIRKIKKLI